MLHAPAPQETFVSWPVALAIPAALLLDRALGEPARWHPLVGFGTLANGLEQRLRARLGSGRCTGLLAWALAVLPPALAAGWLWQALAAQPLLQFAFGSAALYLCLGLRSLEQHGLAIAAPLQAGELAAAREALGRIVSRDTDDLEESGIATGAVESVLENGSDAVLSTLFWFALLGPAGAVLHRLANTLDAMWGYRSDRYLQFGWAAARLDDLLGWLPARLTALGYALLGHTGSALEAWRTQAPHWKSPNAGPVMAAGAGALQLQLGGEAVYAGRREQRPALGSGRPVAAGDIPRALALVQRSAWLWAALAAVATL